MLISALLFTDRKDDRKNADQAYDPNATQAYIPAPELGRLWTEYKNDMNISKVEAQQI